jgi:ATP-dependent Clp protease ATP-binding subunit ClpA
VSRPSPPTVHIPFTPEAEKVLNRSREESAALSEAHVRPGHVLLALLRDDDASSSRGSAAIKMLQEQGVDVDWLRNRVIELLGSR